MLVWMCSNMKSYFYWWEHKIVQPLAKMSGFFDDVVFAVDLRGSSSDVISYCLFLPSIGFSRQEYWSGLPFPSEDHVLSEFFTMTCPSWVALPGMAHSFIELHSPFNTTRLWSMMEIQQLYFLVFPQMSWKLTSTQKPVSGYWYQL